MVLRNLSRAPCPVQLVPCNRASSGIPDLFWRLVVFDIIGCRGVGRGLFIYTLLRSMTLTLRNDGIEWRGTKYPLEELRRGMV